MNTFLYCEIIKFKLYDGYFGESLIFGLMDFQMIDNLINETVKKERKKNGSLFGNGIL
jgi:hypothetical protein